MKTSLQAVVFAKIHVHVYSFKFFRSKNNPKICCRPRFSISPSSCERATLKLSLHERNLSLLSQEYSGWEILRWQWHWKRFELRDMRFKWMKFVLSTAQSLQCLFWNEMIPSPSLSMILYEAKTKLKPRQAMKSVSLQRQFSNRGISKSNTLYIFTGKRILPLMWKY